MIRVIQKLVCDDMSYEYPHDKDEFVVGSNVMLRDFNDNIIGEGRIKSIYDTYITIKNKYGMFNVLIEEIKYIDMVED